MKKQMFTCAAAMLAGLMFVGHASLAQPAPADSAARAEISQGESFEITQPPEAATVVEAEPSSAEPAAPRYTQLWRILGSTTFKSFGENLTEVMLMGQVRNALIGAQPPVQTALPAAEKPAAEGKSLTPPPPPPRSKPANAESAPAAAKPEKAASGNMTFFGRGGTAKVTSQDGEEKAYTNRDMVFINQPGFRMSSLPPKGAIPTLPDGTPVPEKGAVPADPAAPTPPAAPGMPGAPETPGTAPAPEGNAPATPEAQAPGAPDAKAPDAAKEPAETPAQTEAKKRAAEAKAADVERVKALRKEGAWFYNPDGSAMTQEQLDQRLASGDIENIKSVDRYQQSWSAKADYTPEAK